MAPQLRSLLALPLALASLLTLAVTDDAGTRAPTLAAGSYRVLLAADGAAGTALDPYELLAAVATSLGSGWSCTLGADGRVTLAYSGVSGLLDLSGAAWLHNALGEPWWPGAIDCAGAGHTCAYQPLGCVLSPSREADDDWQAQPGQQAYALRSDGVVYGFGANDYVCTRSLRLALLPRDAAVASELAITATPLFPLDRARWRTVPSLTPATYAPPYSLNEFLVHGRGLRCAFALGTLPALLAGTEASYEEGYLHPDTFTEKDPIKQRFAYVEQFYTRSRVVLTLYQQRARFAFLTDDAGVFALTADDGSTFLLAG